MATSSTAVPCLLTPTAKRKHYSATAGTLTLVLQDIHGNTDLDTVNNTVLDITTPGQQISVRFAATNSSITFKIETGKRYFFSLSFHQVNDPLSAEAALKEPCGQIIDEISATNLFPGFFIDEVR